ncbi:MAG TPA: multicopper oxidase family protein [Stellaceae bacterium]|jgi:FtsP/CotA-like multicopper oxidase with cupredoxin domain|nr:multicopper oxidase family protein [Stellaceae bacterium]
MHTRRAVLIGAGVAAGVGVLAYSLSPRRFAPTRALGPAPSMGAGKTVSVGFQAAERLTSLPCFGDRKLPMWTFAEGAWPPVVRLDLGDRLEATLENHLTRAGESTSIHWHGIRLPNDQDGVAYITQPPVAPGSTCRYAYTPPDTGTYFFHPHCDTVEQLGRGMVGILIVDGDTTEPYDSDTLVVLRDWLVEPEAIQFDPFFTLVGAGRAGTYGPLRSANGASDPAIPLPASGDCRLRLVNVDATRIMQISVEGADAAIVAIDGHAVTPFALSTWPMGPAMRADVVIRTPREGGVVRLIDNSEQPRAELARFIATGTPLRKTAFDPAPLRQATVPEPDLNNATRLTFALDVTDAEKALNAATGETVAAGAAGFAGVDVGSLCLSQAPFWTVNGRLWPEVTDAAKNGGVNVAPLASLERNRSYIFEFINNTPFTHPVHLHGFAFTVLSASKFARPVHIADTVLLLPQERVEFAFLADNPGNWMLHCHVIEHQESGMMGYIRVA